MSTALRLCFISKLEPSILTRNLKKCINYCRLSSSSVNTEAEKEYDIVISGGGMVGFAAACAIGQSPKLGHRKILLLESQKSNKWNLPDEYSNRVCAINPQTKKFFQELDIWNDIISKRAQPVSKMQVWESGSDAMITFDETDVGDTVAHIVENDVTLHTLKQHLPDCVEVAYETKVKKYDLPGTSGSSVGITLENGDKISTELLIGADGANSLVRKTMGAKYFSLDYDQMAIVATLELSEEVANTVAWQKFLSTGPIAILPLSSTRSSLVWSTTKKEAKHLLSLPEDVFTDALNSALWDQSESNEFVQNITDKWRQLVHVFSQDGGSSVRQLPPSIATVLPKSRGAFPLGLGHSVHYTAPRVALIGDAAHRVHPLAGQGVNLGFGDVIDLVKVLEETVSVGAKLGDEKQLHKYESTRQLHNMPTMLSVDSLYRLYTTNFTPVVLLRSLGLTAVDACSPLKKRIMSHASA